MLIEEHRAYLLKRGYTEELLGREEILSLPEGLSTAEGVQTRVNRPAIGWVCRSMSGATTGIQSRATAGHEYRWHPAERTQHLPTLYGAEEDHEILYRTGRIILTEGVFDRIAMKRLLPGQAVYARLTRGVSKLLLTLLKRYATQVFLGFDQDGPGQAATREASLRLGQIETHEIRFAAKDPAALLERLGERRAREIMRPQVERWL